MQNIEEICSSQQKEQELDRLNVSSETKGHSKKEKVNNMEDIKEVLNNEANPASDVQEIELSRNGAGMQELSDEHRKDFRASGITDKKISELVVAGILGSIKNIENEPDFQISKHVSGSGWIVKFPKSDFCTFKPDRPRANKNGRVMKYENPYGRTIEVFIPLGFDWNSEEIIITEGIKKAIKAIQEGYNAISISGVWNWCSKKSEDGINPSFKAFVEKLVGLGKKAVYLCFDNDIMQKESVRMALTKLSVYLLQMGIIPKVIKLPYNKGQKLGLDDYLILENSNLDALIEKAKVLPDALFKLAIGSQSVKLGKVINIDNIIFDEELIGLYRKISEGFYEIDKAFYLYSRKTTKKLDYNFLVKKTDFSLVLEYNSITLTQAVTPQRLFNRQILVKSKGNKSIEVVTDISVINKADKLDAFLINIGHYSHLLTDAEVRRLIVQVVTQDHVEKMFICNNAGYNLIEDKRFWVTENKQFCFQGDSTSNLPLVKLAKSTEDNLPKIVAEIVINSDSNFDEYLNKAKSYYGIDSTNTTVENVAIAFIYYIMKSYNNYVEPFIIIGLACLSPYVKSIFEKFRSFPIGYLEGDTATGKSNLLNLIAHLFGLNGRYPKSGNDTGLNILFNLQKYVNIPMLLNEIGDVLRPKFNELVIKSVFDRTPRRRMKQSGNEEAATAINGTLIFNTNSPINKEGAIVNRLLHTLWETGIFNTEEAKRFNDFTKYLSVLMPAIIETISVESILDKIQVWVDSDVLAHIRDTRHNANLAIALAGLEMFLNIANSPEKINLQMLEPKLTEYIQRYESNAEADEFAKFMAIARKVITAKSEDVRKDIDYKETSHKGLKGLHIRTDKDSMSFKTNFVKLYQANYIGSRPLSFREYEGLLKEKGIEKISVNYSSQARYGIFIQYLEFPDVEAWLNEYFESPIDWEQQGPRLIYSKDQEPNTNVPKSGVDIF